MRKDKPIRLSFSLAFQVKYCLTVAVLFIIASVLLYLLLDEALGGGYRQSLRTLYYLDQNLPLYLSIMALLLTLFILVLTLVVTLLVSHQIAGPVFRYEDVLRQMADGVFPRKIETRQTDQLKILLGSLNGLAGRCRETFEAADGLSNSIDKVMQGSGKEFSPLLPKIEAVRQKMSSEADKKGFRGE